MRGRLRSTPADAEVERVLEVWAQEHGRNHVPVRALRVQPLGGMLASLTGRAEFCARAVGWWLSAAARTPAGQQRGLRRLRPRFWALDGDQAAADGWPDEA